MPQKALSFMSVIAGDHIKPGIVSKGSKYPVTDDMRTAVNVSIVCCRNCGGQSREVGAFCIGLQEKCQKSFFGITNPAERSLMIIGCKIPWSVCVSALIVFIIAVSHDDS